MLYIAASHMADQRTFRRKETSCCMKTFRMVDFRVSHCKLGTVCLWYHESNFCSNTKVSNTELNNLFKKRVFRNFLFCSILKIIKNQNVIEFIEFERIHVHYISYVKIENPIFLVFDSKFVSNIDFKFSLLFQKFNFV